MSETSTLSPDVAAVIAAAIAITLDKPHQILAIQQLAVPQDTTLYILNPWSMEGRFEIFRSHRVR